MTAALETKETKTGWQRAFGMVRDAIAGTGIATPTPPTLTAASVIERHREPEIGAELDRILEEHSYLSLVLDGADSGFRGGRPASTGPFGDEPAGGFFASSSSLHNHLEVFAPALLGEFRATARHVLVFGVDGKPRLLNRYDTGWRDAADLIAERAAADAAQLEALRADMRARNVLAQADATRVRTAALAALRKDPARLAELVFDLSIAAGLINADGSSTK